MGLFKSEKPYTAISSRIDHMTTTSGEATDPAALLELMELIQINPSTGTAEAGRALRKHLKHGDNTEQMRAIAIAEAIVENGGRKMVPLVRDSGLGDQMQITARTGASKPRKYATKVLASWAENFSAFSHYAPSKPPAVNNSLTREQNRLRRNERDSHGSRRDGDSSRDRLRDRLHDSDEEYRGRSAGYQNSRSRSPSRSPSPLNLRGQSLESTIALGHSTATHLVNSMITHDGQLRISRETAGYYEQAKQIRRRVLRMITDDSPEVIPYVEQLIKVNEELVESICAYEENDIQPARRAPDSGLRQPSRQSPRPSRRLSRSVSPPPSDYSPPVRSRSPEYEDDDDDPFADSNEAVDAPQHTPVW